MHLKPILSSLLRHPTRAVLIGLQLALTLAVLSNAIHIIHQRVSLMRRPTGIDVPNLIYAQTRWVRQPANFRDAIEADITRLRALPGVRTASVVGHAPLGSSGNGECFTTVNEPGAPNQCANRTWTDERGLETLGLELVAGRDFTAEDIVYERATDSGFPRPAIVTQELADALFPDGSALGESIYSAPDRLEIIGIVRHMMGVWVHSEDAGFVMIQPIIRERSVARYLVRAEPGARDSLLPLIEDTLLGIERERLVTIKTQSEIVAGSYRRDRAMSWMLAAVISLLVCVNTLGVVGLAHSHVVQRTRQIGTRRALGARRRDIVLHFLAENGIVAAGGLLAGVVLAVALSMALTRLYSLPPLEPVYLIASLAGLFLLGQLAVLAPARRAAAIAPAVAARTV